MRRAAVGELQECEHRTVIAPGLVRGTGTLVGGQDLGGRAPVSCLAGHEDKVQLSSTLSILDGSRLVRSALGPLPPQEGFEAYKAAGIGDAEAHLDPSLYNARRATGPASAGRRHPRPRETDRHGGLAGDGRGSSHILSAGSAGLEPRCLLRAGRGASGAPATGVSPRAPWAADHGAGRDVGAPPGAKRRAQGMYRDPGRSAHRPMVQARGVRWLRLRRLGPMPWATRVGAVPGLPGLAPSARDPQDRGQRPKQLPDGARQLVLVVRRWLPERPLGVGPDSRCAVSPWLGRIRHRPPPIGGMRPPPGPPSPGAAGSARVTGGWSAPRPQGGGPTPAGPRCPSPGCGGGIRQARARPRPGWARLCPWTPGSAWRGSCGGGVWRSPGRRPVPSRG